MSALKNHIRSLPAADRQDRTQVISHELRTPLAIIQGYARMIGEESEGRLEHLTEPLLEAADRLGRIIEALVDFEAEPAAVTPVTEQGATSVSRIPLDHLVNRVSRQIMARHADCQVELVLDLTDSTSVPTNVAEPVSKALGAVLDNAIRFTTKGKVTLRSRMKDHTLRLSILDEGPGLPQGSVALTSAFQQGSRGMARHHNGLGLGLHTAKKALASINGSMQLQSRSDRSGARVTLQFPLSPAAPAHKTTLRPVNKPATHRRAA